MKSDLTEDIVNFKLCRDIAEALPCGSVFQW